jgi:hypothetical protein
MPFLTVPSHFYGLSFHLCTTFVVICFLLHFPSKACPHFVFLPRSTTFLVELIILDLSVLIIFDEKYQLRSSSSCNVLHPLNTSALLGSNIPLSISFSNTSSLCSSLNIRQHRVLPPLVWLLIWRVRAAYVCKQPRLMAHIDTMVYEVMGTAMNLQRKASTQIRSDEWSRTRTSSPLSISLPDSLHKSFSLQIIQSGPCGCLFQLGVGHAWPHIQQPPWAYKRHETSQSNIRSRFLYGFIIPTSFHETNVSPILHHPATVVTTNQVDVINRCRYWTKPEAKDRCSPLARMKMEGSSSAKTNSRWKVLNPGMWFRMVR